jgi:hypothetical protein
VGASFACSLGGKEVTFVLLFVILHLNIELKNLQTFAPKKNHFVGGHLGEEFRYTL